MNLAGLWERESRSMRRSGFTLLELLIALAVLCTGLVAAFSLMHQGQKAKMEAEARLVATQLGEALANQLLVDAQLQAAVRHGEHRQAQPFSDPAGQTVPGGYTYKAQAEALPSGLQLLTIDVSAPALPTPLRFAVLVGAAP